MGKHTPGPWINGGEGRSIGRNEEMTFIFAATQENVTKKEQRANVRLACAAPDLLAALEEMRDILEDDHYKCDIGSDGDCWLDEADKHAVMRRAEAAVAEAKGGTQ